MPQNYTTLVSDITNFLDQTDISADLISAHIIPMAELMVSRDLKVSDFTLVTTGTLAVGGTNISMPSNLTLPMTLHITYNGSTQQLLEQKDFGYLIEVYNSTQASGIPVYYGDENASQWRIVPLPSSAFPFTLRYNGQPPPLGGSASTNIVTIKYYDVLVAACMKVAARYLQDDTAAPNGRQGLITIWDSTYQQLVDRANGVDVRRESDEYRAANVPGTVV